ncbi:MAG: ferritin-like domain-containing protein, partial [Thermocrispum sp.]
MFGKQYAAEMINRSAENDTDRRRFLRSAGLAGFGVVGVSTVGGLGAGAASAETAADAQALSDASVLNFALNLEYLEAQFYLHAVRGKGLPGSLTSGKGDEGGVTGGRRVPFRSKSIRQYAEEIAVDELQHVRFLRTALGEARVAQPAIDLKRSFTAAAQAAGIVGPGEKFDAFACEANFLLAAFLFEDVGVTAYKGAAPLIQNKTYLEAAAGILAAEAYHAANIRTSLLSTKSKPLGIDLPFLPGFGRDLAQAANKLSDARDSLDGDTDLDQRVTDGDDHANIVPTDEFGVCFSRSAPQVLNIVYLTNKAARTGGFFPKGVNGEIN